MNYLSLNRKGQDKLISVYWFFILIIIAGGLVMMVNTFYSSPYDVRNFEAQILAEKAIDCVYPAGYYNPLFNSNGIFRQEFKDNFLDRCNLDFDTGEDFGEIEYYIELRFDENGDERIEKFSIEEGNINWKEDCKIQAEKKKLGKCYENSVWTTDPTGKVYLIHVLSIVKKVKENA